MFYISQSLTDNLSAEAFYQLEWDQTVVDNCGTFFSQPDVIADGCTDNLRLLSSSRGLSAPQLAGLRALGVDINEEGIKVARGPDRDARDSGQFGAALRYMYEPLNTEFGAYFINYHSRAPIFSATAASQAVYNLAGTCLLYTSPSPRD